jgi:hypothetical protein
MNMFLREIISLVFILLSLSLSAQLVRVTPERPKPSDWVTITFDASKGNQALMNHQGDVYIHTGLVLGTLEDPLSWAHVQGEWGKDDPKVKMQYLGNNIYRIRFQLRTFYGLPSHRNFLQMAFVFRDVSGAKIATRADGSDIFYPDVNQLKHGPLQEADGRKGQNLGAMTSATRLKDGSLLIEEESQALLVKPYGEEMVQLTYLPYSDGLSRGVLEKFIDPEISGEIVKEGDGFEIALADSFRFHIFTNPIRMELHRDEIQVMADERGCFFDQSDPLIGSLVGIRTRLKTNESIYETGPSIAPINRRGNRMYHHPSEEDDPYQQNRLNHFPLLLSDQGYGIYMQSQQEGYTDIGESQPGIMEVGIRDSLLTWFVIPGPDPRDILNKIARIKTRTPVPYMKDMKYQVLSDEEFDQISQKTDQSGEKTSSMAEHVRQMLATGMGGVPYYFSFPGSPVENTSVDQLIRENQYRVFNPLMRGLSPEKDLTGTLNKNMKLRRKLLPYNYTLAWENNQYGYPLARPMYFHHFDDPETRNIDRQYLWGESLLIAPVLDVEEDEREIYFPEGKWLDFFTYRIYQGGKWQSVKLAPGHLPVMVKHGSFIPLLPDSLSEYKGNALELQYYPDFSGKNSSGRIYIDNGREIQAFKKGDFLLVELTGKVNKKGISVHLNTSGYGFPDLPEKHQINLVVLDIKEVPRKVFINGKKIALLSSFALDANTQMPETYATYIPSRNRLDVFWNWDQLPAEISIKGKFYDK